MFRYWNQNSSQISGPESSVRFLSSNARSLKPKFNSLIKRMIENDLHFAMVTETWFSVGDYLPRDQSLGMIHRPRDDDRRGGGVAIIYKKNLIKLRKLKIKAEDLEVLAASGKIKDENLVIILAYIPPNYQVKEKNEIKCKYPGRKLG